MTARYVCAMIFLSVVAADAGGGAAATEEREEEEVVADSNAHRYVRLLVLKCCRPQAHRSISFVTPPRARCLCFPALRVRVDFRVPSLLAPARSVTTTSLSTLFWRCCNGNCCCANAAAALNCSILG